MINLIKYIFLISTMLEGNNLLSMTFIPIYKYEKLENRDANIFNKNTKVNPYPADTSSSYRTPFIQVIEPSLIHLIIQRETMLDEIKYYDVNHIKMNKIRSLKLLTFYPKSVIGEDSVGMKKVYDYDTSGNVLQYKRTSLKDKDFYINEFLYHDGKLNQVISTAYTEYNDTKTIDTFLVVTDIKDNISQITPLSKNKGRCVPSYALEYDVHNKLKSIMRTVDCRITDTVWTQFNRDYYGRVVDMSYGKCSQRFFARDEMIRISEVVEIDCFEQSHRRDLFVSTRTYDDKTGNLSSINTDIHEIGDDLHVNIRIYLKYGDVGVVEERVEEDGELEMITKVKYEFF